MKTTTFNYLGEMIQQRMPHWKPENVSVNSSFMWQMNSTSQWEFLYEIVSWKYCEVAKDEQGV